MKIDPFTTTVFTNYAQINSMIWINEGNVLETASPTHAILARATVEPVFPKSCGLYSGSRFVNVLKMYKEPDIEFKNSQLVIESGGRTTTMNYGDPMLFEPCQLPKNFKFPSSDIKASISSVVLKDLDKFVRVLEVEDLVIEGKSDELTISVMDVANPSSDYHTIRLGTTDKTFRAVIKYMNMTLLPADYEVEVVPPVGKKGASVKSTTDRIQYLVALDKSSEF